MSTSLEACTVLLSKQIGDYWASTTTGGGSSVHLVDSALKAKAADWITDEAYVIVREGTYDGIERKVSLLFDETLTVQAYADTVGSGIDYELHRLFPPSEKRRALIHAGKAGFPFIFKEIRDQTLTAPASTTDRIDIRGLGLAQGKPHQVWQKLTADILEEPWTFLRNWYVGSDGYLYCRQWTEDYTLRIIGIGYLNFLKASAVSTEWDAEIDLDSPQTEILVAEAALYLYTQMIMPNFTAGDNETFARALAYWKGELRERRAKFGMIAPSPTLHWRGV